MKQTKFQNIFEDDRARRRTLCTRNLVPGRTVYTEKLIRDGSVEYREWIPEKSKLAAGIMNGLNQVRIYEGNTVLYLGASTGTTVSHVSDIVGKKGFVFALDFAPRMVRELVFLCERRTNIAPILGDAHHPMSYVGRASLVDYVYQDIAQRDQAEIFVKNCEVFLKEGGFCMLAVKARSVDITKKPRQVFNEVQSYLMEHLEIVDKRTLEPYEKDHCLFLCKRK